MPRLPRLTLQTRLRASIDYGESTSFMTNKRYYSYWLIAPAAVLFVTFTLGGFAYGLFGSLHFWTITDFRFIGFRNYARIFSDPYLSVAFRNTFVFAGLSLALKVGIGFFLALMLHSKLRGTVFLRAVFFLPAVITRIAIGAMFNIFLHPTIGFVNRFLRSVGLDGLALSWLADGNIALVTLALIEAWQWTGFIAMIILAGLQSIPDHYYDAAAIDGASWWQRIRYVTIPLVLPTLNNVIILQLIAGFRVMELVMVTTEGGPGVSTLVLNLVVYRQFTQGLYGGAAAAVNTLAVIIMVLTIFANRFLRRGERRVEV